jgi:hypothetical protein
MEMDRRSSTADDKATAEAVLRAFENARRQGRPSVECYRAGVAAWRVSHPDQSPEYAAKRAVAVILSRHLTLRVDA